MMLTEEKESNLWEYRQIELANDFSLISVAYQCRLSLVDT